VEPPGANARTPQPPAFAAIIFHADKAEMLRRCIEHHLALGVGHLFVSLNVADPESCAVAEAFASHRVRVARVADYAPDPLDYFSAALRAVSAWAQPDWVMFVDSDEFWVPAGGTMSAVAGLHATDAYPVRRFNAPPLRGADGTIAPLAPPASALVVGARQAMDADYLAAHAETPWIMAKIGPKLMVRPAAVARIVFGAHEFVPARDGVSVTVPDDLLIVHLPFTDEARFRRKIELAGAMLEAHRERLQPEQAWHWRRWLDVVAAGGLSAEFAAQVIDARDVGELTSRGVLTTPAELLATGRLGD
jgi:hypothetical protein